MYGAKRVRLLTPAVKHGGGGIALCRAGKGAGALQRKEEELEILKHVLLKQAKALKP